MNLKRYAPGFLIIMAVPLVAAAQTVPPAPTPTPTPQASPSPTPTPVAPSIRVGTVLVGHYIVTQTPKATDANGTPVTLHSFDLTRAYINVVGTVSSRVSFRLTPDIVRDTDASGALAGNLVYRIKYAYGQFRAGTEAIIRLGIQPTPLIEEEESVYRYRFQGTMFPEREGGLHSSDAGLSVSTPLPRSYGSVFAGVYNGEGYIAREVNDQKAFVMRATIRPSPAHSTLKGLRLIGYVHADHYAKHQSRGRAAVSALFEHTRFNAGVNFMQREDQPTPASAQITGRGYSVFVTPFFQEKGRGVEGLFRWDSFDPDVDAAGRRNRLIGGLAYWFPRDGSAAAAVMAHLEQVRVSTTLPARTTERRFSLSMSISF